MPRVKKRPPLEPPCMEKPKEIIESREFIRFDTFEGFHLSLANLKLPDGDQGDRQPCILFGTYKVTSKPNPNYETEMAQYLKEVKAKEVFCKEMAQWNTWAKQEKKRLLERKLKKAENLLKAHGIIK